MQRQEIVTISTPSGSSNLPFQALFRSWRSLEPAEGVNDGLWAHPTNSYYSHAVYRLTGDWQENGEYPQG